MKMKGKRIKSLNGEIHLPKEVIQRIQSLMSGKEAARTTILSKSWYDAWLTCPTIDLDCQAFINCNQPFEEFVEKTMQRYQDLSLKIESFRLRNRMGDIIRYHDLIACAMKMGATDVQLLFQQSFTLGQEVLGSETLLRLSLYGCEIDGKYMRCSRLKSLSLENVKIREGTISCCNSLEELCLSNCRGPVLGPANLYGLHKLRRLCLASENVDPVVFTEFASRFPCLKDFTLFKSSYSNTNRKIDIATSSLQTIIFKSRSHTDVANFYVPNIKKFTYSGSCLPRLSIKSASREWEFDISLFSNCLHKTSWFLNLKKVLMKLSLSRISLSIKLVRRILPEETEHDVDNIEAVAEPLVLENLRIIAPPTLRYGLLLRLFVAFRPKFVTLVRLAEEHDVHFGTLCKRLMHQVITPNCGIPDQDIFGQFGLKKVCMEKDYVTDEDGCICGPWFECLTKTRFECICGTKTRFELIWDTKARAKLM